MMTFGLIALGAYALITVLFVAGLAVCARRPMPEVDNVIEFPTQQAEEKVIVFNKAA